MENLSAHEVDGVSEAIKATGATLRYLPPYSPDLNPIEQLFSCALHRYHDAAQNVATLIRVRLCDGRLPDAGLDEFGHWLLPIAISRLGLLLRGCRRGAGRPMP